ncbi:MULTISPECIES: LysE family translocator [Micromonospora]|uniref:LysE family translocator n=1 Tax=Micromonospora solifontis TaxID=2487138 RepID=A0ABX9WF86_9ACTN|nr:MULTISPECIES: LysE family translocator [Micromonospora]NES13611.1 LysE family translocator [Micromonospora sp. PPF5-17B]NES37313.1 LysE family translocator [Micromonospora solifontis]NES55423.1 LysE family translocator [Micromonospora sp. PPF5-6]RNL98541.1 LysE family translocator [Micromonospora solifontis]
MRGIAVLGFLAAVAPITTAPGTSLTLVVSRVAAGGRRQGWWVILGTVTGLYVHATLAAAGLAALVLRSSQAFWVVKLVGAGYLAGLGLWLLWSSAGRPARAPAPAPAGPRRLPWCGHHPFPQALLGNVLNPKAAAVYLTLAPQFLEPGRPVLVPMLVLATAHAALHTCWLAGWAAVSGAAARLLRAARVRRLLDRLTGAVLLALGVRAALP